MIVQVRLLRDGTICIWRVLIFLLLAEQDLFLLLHQSAVVPGELFTHLLVILL